MSATELQSAITAQRTGGLAPQTVVVNVGIDATRRTLPLGRECDPVGACEVIGTLEGFSDPEGTVAVRQSAWFLPAPTTPFDLTQPISLRLSGTAPIEYLGHVTATDGRPLWVSELQAATATASGGEVRVVDGWLEGTGGGWSCGPAPMPGPSIPEPFACGVRPMLMTDPIKPVSTTGNGKDLAFPPGSVPVQEGAYEEFAPDPAFDGLNQEPRRALYLVRMVVDDAVNCANCRGWLVVGRLDAAPTPSSSPSPLPAAKIRSADEIAALLGADRGSWVGRAVLLDGHVVPGSAAGCTGSTACEIGVLEGTGEQIVASPYTASLLLPDTDYPTHGVMAMIVRDVGLEYLGWMAYNTDNTFNFTVDELQDTEHPARGPETVIVTGWLIDTPGPFTCTPQPRSLPPDTPFETCGFAWLTAAEVQPVKVTARGWSVTPPPHAIRVQPGAYTEFAPHPQSAVPGVSNVPRVGTFLLRLVSYPPQSSHPDRGWQVVARLDP